MARNYDEIKIIRLAEGLIGKTFGEINNYAVKTDEYGKGTFGHIIESDAYDYDINAISEPDFADAGIELKVTPYKMNKNNTLSAKERLVLNIINYMTEYKNEFYNSHFWYKNKKIQIIWYLYEAGRKKEDLTITHQLLYSFPEEDLKIIKDDWETIINKIKTGKAHEISEADTMYLGACTKGANSSSVRKQPFSEIMAMQRAFCLKTSYMTQLVRKHIGNYKDIEHILNKNDNSFIQFINNVIDKYKGMTQREFMKLFNIETTPKQLNKMIICRMFGVNGDLDKTDEFLKANIKPRTVRVESNGRIKESMPFPYFKFIDILNETWKNSSIRETLGTTKYIFFVFKKKKNEYVFQGIKLWNMPVKVIESNVKTMWEKTKDVISSGNIVKKINSDGSRLTNFPGMRENDVCHVRPHAINSEDTYDLPVKDKLTGLTKYTKQCFWLNNKYLEDILKEYL
ncbi:MAG: Sau3AI family type II restriction endonuclease [Bacilli bacterium]|nr:Sau3AI family type II restriction endonuclease [Bacilli bacterium]MDD4809052.1 Sau3AI family type II restriction endonuclease [Bacilli bacterium]